jgi:hypothetical protein
MSGACGIGSLGEGGGPLVADFGGEGEEGERWFERRRHCWLVGSWLFRGCDVSAVVGMSDENTIGELGC